MGILLISIILNGHSLLKLPIILCVYPLSKTIRSIKSIGCIRRAGEFSFKLGPKLKLSELRNKRKIIIKIIKIILIKLLIMTLVNRNKNKETKNRRILRKTIKIVKIMKNVKNNKVMWKTEISYCKKKYKGKKMKMMLIFSEILICNHHLIF